MKSPIRVALVLLLAACAGSDATSPAASPKGSLTITVDGPPGIKPAIVVTGPLGYSVAVTGSLTLSGLEAGTYTITASDVVVSASTYAPAVPVLNVVVAAADSQVAATVSYVLASGSLDVAISGLPGAMPADVTITGPGGFSRHLTASQDFPALIPGSYQFAASNVLVSGAVLEPTPLFASVDVTASTVPAGIRIGYAPPAPVAWVSVSPVQRTFALIPGLATPGARLQASVFDSGGTLRPGRIVTWASEDAAIATVDATGLVVAVGPGATGISATSEGVFATAAVTVVSLSAPPPIAGIWTYSSTGRACHGTGTITLGQPVDSGYYPATAVLRGGCSSGGTIRNQSFSYSGTSAFHVTLDGAAFGFTIGACRFYGRISDILGSSPTQMSGSGHCGSIGSGLGFNWSATKQ